MVSILSFIWCVCDWFIMFCRDILRSRQDNKRDNTRLNSSAGCYTPGEFSAHLTNCYSFFIICQIILEHLIKYKPLREATYERFAETQFQRLDPNAEDDWFIVDIDNWLEGNKFWDQMIDYRTGVKVVENQ